MRAAWALFLCLPAIACGRREVAAPASEPPPPPPADAAAASDPAPALPSFDDLEPAAVADRGDAGTVTIKLVADARRQARVYWGRKDLGVAPLEIARPRGSAPLDLTVLAPGCLPLHTRVFADRDDTLSLRLYTDREAASLPGFSPEAAAAAAVAPAAPPPPAKLPGAKPQGKI